MVPVPPPHSPTGPEEANRLAISSWRMELERSSVQEDSKGSSSSPEDGSLAGSVWLLGGARLFRWMEELGVGRSGVGSTEGGMFRLL